MILEVYKDRLIAAVINEQSSVFAIDRSLRQPKIILSDFDCISMCTVPTFDVKRVPFVFIRSRDKVYLVNLKSKQNQGNTIMLFKQILYYDATS